MANHNERYSDEESDVLSIMINRNTLLLHNDDLHTFDFVVDALIEVCDHDSDQAEQCAYITHYKGKCDVKKGKMSKIRPMRDRLVEKGLKVTIV
ncbi:ATP-dependent Clp protease adaptor ClpS [Marinifilum sp. N1E240]|uniref:ATP-dependent Clp protease adaptor ClpS n=1 Tax=Marinifilum sp. N1E240 TaxID=2608082 RepID=UPI00128C6E13|nr:ATP-dependent Clp protease adaptor ClpS [Marinifilum sp. N1E240]MPQ47544.1 ATP-dependent Clp protease adaptor ClpS [Marinifilum sp. N1E240]